MVLISKSATGYSRGLAVPVFSCDLLLIILFAGTLCISGDQGKGTIDAGVVCNAEACLTNARRVNSESYGCHEMGYFRLKFLWPRGDKFYTERMASVIGNYWIEVEWYCT